MVSGIHSSCGRISISIAINPSIPIICGVFMLTLRRASNNTGEQVFRLSNSKRASVQ